MFLINYLLERLINNELYNNIMNIDDLDRETQRKYGKIRSRILVFELVALLLIVPSIWILPQYIEIRHAIGITIINCLLYAIAFLKEKEII